MRVLPASALAVCGLIASACGTTGFGGVAAGQAATKDTTVAARSTPSPAAPAPGSAAVAAKPLAGKVVVIDPGHNGGNYRDPAAVNRKVNVLPQGEAARPTGPETNA